MTQSLNKAACQSPRVLLTASQLAVVAATLPHTGSKCQEAWSCPDEPACLPGGTASGKTTVCDSIMQRLHDQCVVMLSQDSFYRGLTDAEIENVTSASPAALLVPWTAADLPALRTALSPLGPCIGSLNAVVCGLRSIQF